MACSWAGETKGAYLYAMAKTLVWLGGKVVVLGGEPEMVVDKLDELDMFGWRGSWGMNGLGEWIVVDIIGEVVVKEAVFTIFEDSVETQG